MPDPREAPEQIWINPAGGFWSRRRIALRDIEYVRRDRYDEVCEAARALVCRPNTADSYGEAYEALRAALVRLTPTETPK